MTPAQDQVYLHIMPHSDQATAINCCADEVFRASDAEGIIGPAAAAWMAEPQDSPQRQWFAGVVQRYNGQGGDASVPGRMHACMHASLQEAEVASDVMAGAVDLQLTMEHLSEEAQEALHALAAAAPAEPLVDYFRPGHLNPVSSYILGLVCADGHVSQGRVEIGLVAGDMAQLLHILTATGFVNKAPLNK